MMRSSLSTKGESHNIIEGNREFKILSMDLPGLTKEDPNERTESLPSEGLITTLATALINGIPSYNHVKVTNDRLTAGGQKDAYMSLTKICMLDTTI